MSVRFCLTFSLLLVACSSSPDGGPGSIGLDDAGTDPNAYDRPMPSQVSQDVTCAIPDQSCAGSCRQGFAGVTGVGSLTCRCMDVGSGFGAQWICDESACGDAGVPSGGYAGNGSRAPAVLPPPNVPDCSDAQGRELAAMTSQAQVDAFADAAANTDCVGCLLGAMLACATERDCGQAHGDVLCCLDNACGDELECRSDAIGTSCRSHFVTLVDCADADDVCALDTETPPAVCFP